MKLTLPVLAALLLTACGHNVATPTFTGDNEPATRISPYYEAYGNTEGLRVYRYGAHTLIKAKSPVNAWEHSGKTIKFEKIGHYFRSEKLLSDFYIKNGLEIARIKKFSPKAVPVQAEGKTTYFGHKAAPKADETPALIVKHYPELEKYSAKQLEGFQVMIDKLASKPSTTGEALFNAQVNQNALRKKLKNHDPVVIVNFDLGRTRFKPDNELVTILIPAAKAASAITLGGRTDSVKASKADHWIAQERAENAKAYLVSKGVNSEIITINHLPEGDFLLPPDPQSSKQVNRRVEIEIKS